MHGLAKNEILRGLKSSSAAFDVSAQLIQGVLLLRLNLHALMSRRLARFLALEQGSRYISERVARKLPVAGEFARGGREHPWGRWCL